MVVIPTMQIVHGIYTQMICQRFVRMQILILPMNCSKKKYLPNGNVFYYQVIKLAVWFFEVDGYGGIYCHHDYLDIYGSPKLNIYKRIGRYCGSDIPNYITSTGPDIFLNFISSKYVTASGFNISFEVVDSPGKVII